MVEKIIEAKNIHKTFGNNHVLQGIDFNVKRGESFVILGGSGSGKSVLLKCIIGLIKPDIGSVVNVLGEDVTKLNINNQSHLMEKFGVLFQGGALFDSLPVWRNISFGLLQNKGISIDAARKLAEEKLGLVGLKKDVADLYPSELSGGMIKRVALARAIAADPEVLFLDEPTAGLDPIMAGVISDLINKCSKELGATTITITHDMHCAEAIADYVAMIYEGKFIWQGAANKLMKSDNEYVEQFVKGSATGPIKLVA